MPKLMIYNDRWCSGGVEALWSNLLPFFPDGAFETVLLVGQKETDIYDGLLQQKKVRTIVINKEIISNPIKRNLKIKKQFKNILFNEKPDILHINVCNSIGLLYAKKAKKAKIPCVIVHSHNTRIEHDKFKIKILAHKYMRLKYKNAPDYKFACSTEAGKFLFGKKSNFSIIKNGVNIKRFEFDGKKGNNFRKLNGIDSNTKVFCHIGRFAEQKNHKYLIELFAEIAKQENDSKLILVGEGALKQTISKMVEEHGLTGKVIFTGTTDCPEEILFASDYFLLPSLHEGLPVTAVEAQATGIVCFLADTISKETKILDSCNFFSLKDDIKEVACKIVNTQKTLNRLDAVKVIKEKGFSISDEAEKLSSFYKEVADKK